MKNSGNTMVLLHLMVKNNSKWEYVFNDDATKLKSTSIEKPNENSNKTSLNCVSLHIETIYIQIFMPFLCTGALSY